MGKHNTDFFGTLFQLRIDVDSKHPKTYAVHISTAGLGLPDRDYYLKSEFAAQKSAYLTYVRKLLELVSWPNAEALANQIVELETKIAEASWTKAEERDPVSTYNPMQRTELIAHAPHFAWNAFFRSAGLSDVDRFVVVQKSAFSRFSDIFAQTPLDTLK